MPPNFLFRDRYPCPGDKSYEAEKERDVLIERRKRYYAMIESLDWNVGRMMTVLEETGHKDNTIVVLVSDHGQMDGAHAKRNQRKTHPYEESVGVPLIVNIPGSRQSQGMTISAPMCTEDLFPTLLGLAGLSPKHEKPGLDVTPVIRGERDELSREGILLEIMHDFRGEPQNAYHKGAWRGFRGERYKYVVLGDDEEGGKPWQFFDLQEAPYEMSNLIDDPTWRDEIVRHH